jgi:hypothetical protein
MIIGPDQAPPVGGMGGSIHKWGRGTSPWHKDCFPSEFKSAAPEQGEKPLSGWEGFDWCGNVIAWVPDGTVIPQES